MTLTNYTKHIQELDNAHHLHPFMVHNELRAKSPRVITKGKGVYIWDSEGRKIIEQSGLSVISADTLAEAAKKAVAAAKSAT